MTVRELSKYYKLHERLERNKEMLTSLSAAAGLKAQVIDGMPHAPGVSDKVGDMAVELADLEETIAADKTNVRPVAFLKSNVTITDASGTPEDPFVVS